MTTGIDSRYRIINSLFPVKAKKKTALKPLTLNQLGFSGLPSFNPGTADDTSILKMTVRKMQAAIMQRPVIIPRQTTQTASGAPAAASSSADLAASGQDGSAASTVADDAVVPDDPYARQRDVNLDQAASIISQLNLGDGDAWGITSMAEDLAVFGRDFTALQTDPRALAEEIRAQSREMLADLDSCHTGGEAEYIAQRNRITGASARLTNGLEGASVIAGASVSASWAVAVGTDEQPASVSVGGVEINASIVIGVGNVIVDPLVLDLNGDGIDLSSAEDGVDFDMNGDGVKNRTGFIRGDDAFLFIDSHGDGLVHDGRQLFGNSGGYANGFDMLAQYDDNGDGVIDENDAIYDQLMVWQEKNENGVCEEGETMSLREAGIKSINLGYQNVREDDGKGNLVGQSGSFTRIDDTTGYAADVWLREMAALEK